MHPSFPLPLIKRLAAVFLAGALLLAVIAWINPVTQPAQVSTPTPAAQTTPAAIPTPTLNPIPELNPNPNQTDGVILGAAVILAVIVAGVWTYGRRRKE